MSIYYLAIDQGSQSSRAVLFDDMGRQLKKCSRQISTQRNATGHVEHDTAELLDSVTGVVRDLFESLDETTRQNIAACGIATQRSSVLAWNAAGEALSPILSWQDVRAAESLHKLRSSEQKIQQLTGLPLAPYYGASKLHWLMKTYAIDEAITSTLRLSPMVSYLLYHLLHKKIYRVDHSNAQRTQLMALESTDWSAWLCDRFDVPVTSLPVCTAMCAEYGDLLDSGIPVTTVCGDQNAAFYGVGELPTTTALVNLGSGAFILRSLPEYRVSQKQLTGIAYSDESEVQYLREATVNGAGNALSWFEQQYEVENLQLHLPDWLEQKTSPPIFINSIGGLGSPWWNDQLSPHFISDNDTHGNAELDHADMAVAVIESILFMLHANLDLMREEAPIHQLRLSGGLSQLDGLCQKLANLCQLTVERVDYPEATSRGVAWLAAGRPAGWNNIDSASQSFLPVTDKPLLLRYAAYMKTLESLLEKTS